MKSRHGKIARLPHALREELNRRLDDGEVGTRLLAWLNGHGDVRAVLATHFGGRPINKPNLTHWRQGGFREWRDERELLQKVKSTARHTAKLARVGSRITHNLGTLFASRYAAALAAWDGDPDSPSGHQLRALAAIRHDIVALCRGDYNSTRLQLQRERFDYEYAREMHDLQVETIQLQQKNALREHIQQLKSPQGPLASSKPPPLGASPTSP